MNKHTFAICAYGESEFLETCILSVKNQSIESDVIMTTSTPNNYLRNIAKKHGLELFSHENGGIGNDWNFAYRCAKTKYITLAHQDDVYDARYCETILGEMKKIPNALIGFSLYLEIRKDEIVTENKNLKIKKILLKPLAISNHSRLIKRRILSLGSPICCPAVTYNKELLRDFSFDTELKTSLDWDAWERLSRKEGSFVYVKKHLMFHRIHEESETSKCIENKKRAVEDLMMFERFWPRFLAKGIYRFYSKSEEENELT